MYHNNVGNLLLTEEEKRKAAHYTFSRINRLYLGCKRAFDITVSLAVIVFLLSWLLPLLALLIKLDSAGPVFFIQKRVGSGGKLFKCIKLRSMVTNAQANTKQAQLNDPRITSLGSFLRKSCLDELPQFFNVLIGNMSIVGPRPHMVKDCEDFSKVVPAYDARHLVKPGITGIAQVKGCRGETKSVYDVMHRYQWDMFYIRNICFGLDTKIIYQTFIQTVARIVNPAEQPEASAAKKPLVAKEIRRSNFGEQLVEAFIQGEAKSYFRK